MWHKPYYRLFWINQKNIFGADLFPSFGTMLVLQDFEE